jgi:hypothetical protein
VSDSTFRDLCSDYEITTLFIEACQYLKENQHPESHGITSLMVARETAKRALARFGTTPTPIHVSERHRTMVKDAVACAIGASAYDCTRVWNAWSVGTMDQDDFAPIVDDDSRLSEIADAAINALNEQGIGTAPIPVAERLHLLQAGIRSGYMAGHDATVEGRYGDPDEVAADLAPKILQELDALPLPAAPGEGA